MVLSIYIVITFYRKHFTFKRIKFIFARQN